MHMSTDLCNIEAEQALLGSLILNASSIDAVSGLVERDHFFEPLHGEIYAAIGQLARDGRVVTPITLEPFFRNVEPVTAASQNGDGLTVTQYLGRLAAAATTTVGAPAYARIVRDYAGRRSLSQTGLRIQQLAGDPCVSIASITDDAVKGLDAVTGSMRPESYSYADTADVMRSIRERKARGGGITGISTGYPKLDDMIDGLRPATLTIIGARPKQGKTANILSIIRNLCRAQVKCVFFSLEMPRDQIVQRLISMESGVDFISLARGRYRDDEDLAIEDASTAVDGWPLLIDDAAGLTASAISARARTAVKSDGCRVVLVDYLQRISPEKGGKRYEEVTAISMAIADLRKTLSVPIVAAAQLNRKITDRSKSIDWSKFSAESTRPNDGDLRDSGQIEQDADALLFINRPEVHLELMKPTDPSELMDWENMRQKWRGRAEIIAHYNRSGRTGIIDFRFVGPLMRFDECLG
jgi:replicative DNA helicase